MNQLTRAVAVDNVTINKTALGKLQTVAGAVMQYSDTRHFAGSFTRDTSLASGTQEITGLGFSPKSLEFLVAESGVTGEMSVGFDNGIAGQDFCVTDYSNVTAGAWYLVADAIYIANGGGGAYIGTVTSLTAGGFIINWTKSGSPTGIITVAFRALR